MRLQDAALVTVVVALLFISGAYFLHQASGSLLIDSVVAALFSIGMAFTFLLGLILLVWAFSGNLSFFRDIFQQLPASWFFAFLVLIVVCASLGLFFRVLSEDNFMKLLLTAIGAATGYGVRAVEESRRTPPKPE